MAVAEYPGCSVGYAGHATLQIPGYGGKARYEATCLKHPGEFAPRINTGSVSYAGNATFEIPG